MGRAAMGLDRELQHRNIGLGIHQQQRRPGAVIEPARRIDLGGKPGFVEMAHNVVRQIRRSGGWIVQTIEGFRKAVEVMNRFPVCRSARHRLLRLPMRRGDDDGARLSHRLATDWPQIRHRLDADEGPAENAGPFLLV